MSWTGFALFQVPWESGTGVTQRKGASSFPSTRALPRWAEGWELPVLSRGSAGLADGNDQPPRAETQAHSLVGGHPAHPRLQIYPCRGQVQHQQECGSQGGWCSSCFLAGDAEGDRHAGTCCNLPSAPVSQQDSDSVQGQCQTGTQWPILTVPWLRDREMSSLGLYPPAWPPSSLLPPSRRMLLPPLAPASPLVPPGPGAGAHTSAFPPLAWPWLGCCQRGTGSHSQGVGWDGDGVLGPRAAPKYPCEVAAAVLEG